MVSRLASLAGLALAVSGARISRRNRLRSPTTTKVIGGVPVVNAHEVSPSAETSWVLVAKEGVDDQQMQEMCARTRTCKLVGHPGAGGVPFLTMKGTERDLEKVADGLIDVLDFIEPDMQASVEPPSDMTGFASGSSWGLKRVGMETAHGTGKGVHVYILDTGIRVTHKDFGGRAVATIDVTSGSLVECDGNDATCAADQFFHGTHCAGTAGGTTYGVATEATLHAVKVLGRYGSGDFSWCYEALDWIVTKGSRPFVASLSLGGKGQSEAFGVAVTAAVEAGLTVVVAGGNSNTDSCKFSPAYVPAAITVGSTRSGDFRSDFSNYGTCTDMWAPGSDIIAPWFQDDETTYKSSGTSMACPHVSGAIALLLEKQAELTPAEILTKLKATGQPNKVGTLTTDDSNMHVYVGTDSQGPYCPDTTYGPDRSGDCKCGFPTKCFQDGKRWCDFSMTERWGRRSDGACSASCTNCKCQAV